MFWAVFLSLVGLGLLALVGQVVKRVVGGNKLQVRNNPCQKRIFLTCFCPASP